MKKGFTLVEIMIVVAIIALLAAIAIPNFLGARRNAAEAAAQATLRAISTAYESYATRSGGDYNVPVGTLVAQNYLNKDYVTDCTDSHPCQGYSYTCTPEATGYTCTAEPKGAIADPGGAKTYRISTGGILTEVSP